MTSPIGSTSPFIGNTPAPNNKDTQEVPSTVTSAEEEFSIHTMQDDILKLQKKAEMSDGVTDANAVKKSMPTPIPMPEPPKKTTNPNDISSKIVQPLIQQVVDPKKRDFVEIPLSNDTPTDTKSVTYKILLITIVILTIVGVGLGGYYFWITRTPAEKTAPPVQPIVETPAIVTPEPPAEKYSSEKPNYLVLDLATLSSEDIKKTIADTAEELKSVAKDQVPYEFIVVDANNNPVALPIFATATKLNLSTAILNSLGESFFLFIYNDNENSRLSLAADIIKKDLLPSELSKQEKNLVTDASFLFLNEKPEITKGAFQDSTYKNTSIRFFNVNSQITMSIDYAFINDKLIIATSKNTMRAIIDKLLPIKPQPLPSETGMPADSAATAETPTPVSSGE